MHLISPKKASQPVTSEEEEKVKEDLTSHHLLLNITKVVQGTPNVNRSLQNFQILCKFQKILKLRGQTATDQFWVTSLDHFKTSSCK